MICVMLHVVCVQYECISVLFICELSSESICWLVLHVCAMVAMVIVSLCVQLQCVLRVPSKKWFAVHHSCPRGPGCRVSEGRV